MSTIADDLDAATAIRLHVVTEILRSEAEWEDADLIESARQIADFILGTQTTTGAAAARGTSEHPTGDAADVINTVAPVVRNREDRMRAYEAGDTRRLRRRIAATIANRMDYPAARDDAWIAKTVEAVISVL